MVDARRAVPRKADVPLHVGIVGEHLAVVVEGEVVRVAETAGDHFDEAAGHVGAENRAAGRGDAGSVAVGIFVARLDEVAFVGVGKRAARIGLGVDLREVADEDVEHTVGAEMHGVWPVLADVAAELDDRGDLIAAAVVVLVDDLVQRAAARAFADGVHAVAQRQDALDVFDFVAERGDGLELAVVVRVADQQQRPAFLGRQDAAIGH